VTISRRDVARNRMPIIPSEDEWRIDFPSERTRYSVRPRRPPGKHPRARHSERARPVNMASAVSPVRGARAVSLPGDEESLLRLKESKLVVSFPIAGGNHCGSWL
jgi:hypothetical protein